GGTIRVVETVSKSGYDDGASTSAAKAVVNGTIATVKIGRATCRPSVGTSSTLTAGTYNPNSGLSRSYQWRLCDAGGSNCNDIAGETNATYTPVAGDVGGTIRVVETVSKAGYDDGSSTSAAKAVVNGTIATV